MAARNLPAQAQKKVISIGTGGAILIRSLATIVAVYLLKIPGLMFVGGLLLVWMAYKLLVENKEEESNVKSAANFLGAVRTIIIIEWSVSLILITGILLLGHQKKNTIQ